MIYLAAEALGFDGLLNLIRYITFRSGAALFTALAVALVIGPGFIRWLRQKQGKDGQPIRADGPASHLLTKKGTPTMGGLMILASMTIATLLWMDLGNGYTWAALLVTLGFGAIGFMDDYDKVMKRSAKGLSGKLRLALEFAIGGAAVGWIVWATGDASLYLPILRDYGLPLGVAYIAFGAFIIAGFGNAVNLTDGLDGLATMPVIIAALSLGFIAYLVGNVRYSDYLGIHHVADAGELAVFTAAIIGACLGFLWFNAPAAVFMGDTGSLALGGALGTIAVITKHEIVLLVIGGLFVLETVSVIVQVASFKSTGKRVFKMAPLHHHYEALGWSESTVVIRFWIISIMLALAGLATLKLR